MVVKLVETQREHQAALFVRVRVFVQEQGVPVEEELDEDDGMATHAIALLNGAVVGTGRVVYPLSPVTADQPSGPSGLSANQNAMLEAEMGEAKIGRMAVDRECRRRSIGSLILKTLEEEARRQGTREAILHAQTYVKPFYAAHGYVAEGRAVP